MKKTLKTGFSIVCLSFIAHVVNGAPSAPTFGEYHEPIMKLKAGAKPKLVSSQDHEFKTRIAEASKQRINFSGHYVLSSFGCGASCIMSFALDKKTGEVAWLPFTICCWDDVKNGAEPISFKKDSRLVVITGSRNEQGKGVYYYEFKDAHFVLIQEVEH